MIAMFRRRPFGVSLTGTEAEGFDDRHLLRPLRVAHKGKGYPFMLAQGWHYQPPDGAPRWVTRGQIYSALRWSGCSRRVQSVLTKERSMQPAPGQWD